VTQESVTSLQSSLVKHEFIETLRALDGQVAHLLYHQQRYEKTLKSLGVRSTLVALEQFVNPPKEGLYRVRLCYTPEGVNDVSYHPYTRRTITRLQMIEAANLIYDKKYADRSALDALFAQRGACDEVLITKGGYLQDTTIANIALFDGQQWFTPADPLLEGTTRARLLDQGFLKKRAIHKEDLGGYVAFALMNAMIDFAIIADKNIEDIMC